MAIDTKERTFEEEIEYCLSSIGKKSEKYAKGNPIDFDRKMAMDKNSIQL